MTQSCGARVWAELQHIMEGGGIIVSIDNHMSGRLTDNQPLKPKKSAARDKAFRTCWILAY